MRKHEQLSNMDLRDLLLNNVNRDIEFRGQYEEELVHRDQLNQKAVLSSIRLNNHDYYMRLMELCIEHASKKSSPKLTGDRMDMQAIAEKMRKEAMETGVAVVSNKQTFKQPQPMENNKEHIVTEEFTAIPYIKDLGFVDPIKVPVGSKLIKLDESLYNVITPDETVWLCQAEDIDAYIVGMGLPSIGEMLDSIQYAVRVYKFEPNSAFDSLESIYRDAENHKAKFANTSTLG